MSRYIDADALKEKLTPEALFVRGIYSSWTLKLKMIEAVSALIDEQPDALEWISVEDRYSEDECLAIGFQGAMLIGYIYQDGGSNTGYSVTKGHEVLHDVSHWMSLPDLPEGE